jgi:hypothetical protein
MSSNKRAGRPKASPQTGPLVLEGDRIRVKIELELSAETAAELKEYSRWVELSSARTAREAMFATADYALRKLFRRDQLWQQHRRKDESGESPSQSASPSQPPATVVTPARTAASARTASPL